MHSHLDAQDLNNALTIQIHEAKLYMDIGNKHHLHHMNTGHKNPNRIEGIVTCLQQCL